ncbi:hypothetical protein M427DRAFT_502558 [Gonapodya prolifera JEL478]|uniref:Uncharacterized protein n=1 Tax=Gonapodya prolifera (strain JEL478) TaxID=1344416 RepID=A0A139A762_GONPJ|nr:hypothetical protein M427DRAFT_502558 [Gonapodya prolifera JEL478]|eukprot:KXS12295.1 hypothetical protein M427DRAFT_502558 [Gonapodya prolifera JEL478]
MIPDPGEFKDLMQNVLRERVTPEECLEAAKWYCRTRRAADKFDEGYVRELRRIQSEWPHAIYCMYAEGLMYSLVSRVQSEASSFPGRQSPSRRLMRYWNEKDISEAADLVRDTVLSVKADTPEREQKAVRVLKTWQDLYGVDSPASVEDIVERRRKDPWAAFMGRDESRGRSWSTERERHFLRRRDQSRSRFASSRDDRTDSMPRSSRSSSSRTHYWFGLGEAGPSGGEMGPLGGANCESDTVKLASSGSASENKICGEMEYVVLKLPDL